MSAEQKNPSHRDDIWLWNTLGLLRETNVVADARAYANELESKRKSGRWLRLTILPQVWMRCALATLAVLAMLGVTGLWEPRETLQTNVGELRTVTLADGSTVTLNTDTLIRFSFSQKERRVDLIRGEARFDVAHDVSRPFRVQAGSVVVTAVGTAFDVAALPKRTTVMLLEGRVVVEAKAQGTAAATTTTLSPGDQLMVAPDGHVNSNKPSKPELSLSWQQGLVDINDLTLNAALAEINRYSETKVVVRSRTLQERRVSGIFRTGDVEAVTNALCLYFNLQVVTRSKQEIVLAPSSS